MFLDLTLLSSGGSGDEEGGDTVADGGNEDVADVKDDPDNDSDADDEDNDDDCESDEAVATAVVLVIIGKDSVEDDDSGVDCSSEVSAGG